jgi:Cu/Ag efflux protein CusF
MGLVAVMILAAVPAFADGDNGGEKEKPKTERIRGIAKEVNAKTSTLVATCKVDGKDQAVTFSVAADAKIRNGEDVLQLADIKVGDKVRVNYTEADGKKTAVYIRIENDEK